MTAQLIDFIIPVAFKDVFEVIAPEFQRQTGHRFCTTEMLNPEVPGHIAQGYDWSIAVSNPNYVQEIIATGDAEQDMGRLGYSPLTFAVLGDGNVDPDRSTGAIAACLLNA